MQVVCHKGANQYAPENTYASTQLAIEMGADYVEIDVSQSADGVFYVFHGPELSRTTDAKLHTSATLFSELTSSEIDKLDAGSWFGVKYTQEKVPRLIPFLTWIRGRAKVYLDIKSGTPEQIRDILYETKMETQCFLWSRDDTWARSLRELDQNLLLKVNVQTPEDVRNAHAIYAANIVETRLEHMTPALQEACKQLHIKLMVFEPSNNPERVRAILSSGHWPDMINLDFMDVFLQVVKEIASLKFC